MVTYLLKGKRKAPRRVPVYSYCSIFDCQSITDLIDSSLGVKTSGIWSYREFPDGSFEAWTWTNVTVSQDGTSGSSYYTQSITLDDLPLSITNSRRGLSIMANSQFYATNIGLSGKSVSFRLFRASGAIADGATVTISAFVQG